MPRPVTLASARIRTMSADTVVRRNPPSALIPSQLVALFDSIAAPIWARTKTPRQSARGVYP